MKRVQTLIPYVHKDFAELLKLLHQPLKIIKVFKAFKSKYYSSFHNTAVFIMKMKSCRL